MFAKSLERRRKDKARAKKTHPALEKEGAGEQLRTSCNERALGSFVYDKFIRGRNNQKVEEYWNKESARECEQVVLRVVKVGGVCGESVNRGL